MAMYWALVAVLAALQQPGGQQYDLAYFEAACLDFLRVRPEDDFESLAGQQWMH
jgi:hypothetical protein